MHNFHNHPWVQYLPSVYSNILYLDDQTLMKKHSLKIIFKIFWLKLVWLFKFHFFLKYFSNDKFLHEFNRRLWVVAISTTRKNSFMPVKLNPKKWLFWWYLVTILVVLLKQKHHLGNIWKKKINKHSAYIFLFNILLIHNLFLIHFLNNHTSKEKILIKGSVRKG